MGAMAQQVNVLGTELQPCSFDPITGYYRNGLLREPRRRPRHAHGVLPGDRRLPRVLQGAGQRPVDADAPVRLRRLVDGDQWCVCADRWKEALDAGRACPVVLESTHMSTLEYVDLADLRSHAVTA